MSTPKEQRQDRIKYLRRQQDRKYRLPDFISFINTISEKPVTENDVVSIEESDNIWNRIHTSEIFSESSFCFSFPIEKELNFLNLFSSLKDDLLRNKQYFTTNKFYDECFLNIETAFCIENYNRIIEYDGDTFYIYDHTISNGLWVDTNEGHWRNKGEHRWTFELKVFGLEWIEKVYQSYKGINLINL